MPLPRFAADGIMNGMGPSFADTIFLFLLALIIFGPKRLPEIGRQIGKVLNELKRASNEFKSQIQTEMDSMERQENAKKMLAPAQPPSGTIATLPLKPAPEIESPAVDASEVISSDLTSSKTDYPEDNSAEHKTQAVIDLKSINHPESSEALSDPNAESTVKATNV